MQIRSIATFAVVSMITIPAAPAARASPTQVMVRIEGRTKTLFEGPILTEGHDVHSSEPDGGNAAEDIQEHPCDGINPNDPQNVIPGPTPTAAAVDAMSLIGETAQLDGQWYPGYEDYLVKRLGSEEENAEKEDKSWGILVNNVFTNVGGCQDELSAGDEVLWIFNAFESKPILGLFAARDGYTSGERPLTTTAQLDKPLEVEVAAYNGHGEGVPPASPERTPTNAEPFQGADVSPVSTSEKGFETVETASPETVTTNDEGKASIVFTTPGWHRIEAGTALDKEGEKTAIRSNRLDVCVPAAGEAGCGEPPAEDRLRALPQYLETPREETEAQPEETPNTNGPHLVAGPGATAASTQTSASTSVLTPTQTPSSTVAGLSVTSIGPARLLLKLAAPGTATVRIAHLLGKGRNRHLQTVKTITVRASKAGVLDVKLPRLAPGSYRVTISLAGARTVVKSLTVPRRRR